MRDEGTQRMLGPELRRHCAMHVHGDDVWCGVATTGTMYSRLYNADDSVFKSM